VTARVVVNRYWGDFFGRALAETAEDLGTQGHRPSHPELLDWLATEFVRGGWSMKGIQRTITGAGITTAGATTTSPRASRVSVRRRIRRPPP
jgi:Protein of unknown function (DUF1553)